MIFHKKEQKKIELVTRPAPGSLELAVEHRVEDWVVVLHVLDQEGVSEAEGRLEVLLEGVVQK